SALQALASETPELVFTDVRMPGVDGLGLLERFAALTPRPAVVVMSAFTDVASTAAAYRLGAFDYLPKPFDLDVAVAAARRALAQTTVTLAPLPSTPEPAHELLGRSAPMR